jgi:hypothetical protein
MDRLRIGLALAILVLGTGCASNQVMRQRLGDGCPHLMTDTHGNTYVVEHHLGDTYHITPLESYPVPK